MKVKDAYLLFTPPILNELCFRENITGKYNKLIDRLYGGLSYEACRRAGARSSIRPRLRRFQSAWNTIGTTKKMVSVTGIPFS